MAVTSRAQLLAQRTLGHDSALPIIASLRQMHVVVGIPDALARSRLGQIGIVTVANILCRLGALAPNMDFHVPPTVDVLEGIPLLTSGRPLLNGLVDLARKLSSIQTEPVQRGVADKHERYDFGLFVGQTTVPASQSVVIGADRWLAGVRTACHTR